VLELAGQVQETGRVAIVGGVVARVGNKVSEVIVVVQVVYHQSR